MLNSIRSFQQRSQGKCPPTPMAHVLPRKPTPSIAKTTSELLSIAASRSTDHVLCDEVQATPERTYTNNLLSLSPTAVGNTIVSPAQGSHFLGHVLHHVLEFMNVFPQLIDVLNSGPIGHASLIYTFFFCRWPHA
mmetsp:Transcript_108232/g.214977  ORF Transcript_108232/g.214977 Transcript_108232/m.214977 type:complete len:135 (-) Transcript_108232:261-665(-)